MKHLNFRTIIVGLLLALATGLSTAHAQPFSREELGAMLDVATRGISEIVTLQRSALGPVS